MLAIPAGAADVPCASVTVRVATLRRVLMPDWLTIRPDQVKKAWYRPLQRVPTGCQNPSGECLLLGNASVSAGSEASQCSEAFIFNANTPSGPMQLTTVDLKDTFPTLEGALRGAEELARVVQPPNGACPFLSLPWAEPERGRACHWAADGDWVIVLSFSLVRRGAVWETGFNISRSRFS